MDIIITIAVILFIVFAWWVAKINVEEFLKDKDID